MSSEKLTLKRCAQTHIQITRLKLCEAETKIKDLQRIRKRLNSSLKTQIVFYENKFKGK